MATTTTLYLDVAEKSKLNVVFAKEADAGTRVLAINFTNHGSAFTIPSGTTARFRVLKSDGHTVIFDAAVVGNAVSITMPQQVLSSPGLALADVSLISGDTVLSCESFVIQVDKSGIDAGLLRSVDYLPILDSLASQADTFLTKYAQGSVEQVWKKTSSSYGWGDI